ncbi:efflux RND transporter permease subunit [Caminibacter pacificus]|uniref:Efflux RND transporter permease subunit n=1 Tax=Caminibacter pacificus TaxID=1424653 RepID=A0AAJ4RDG7_9BACT|nr:efflux RND transporter permease subunit [Caminibacter pacificus]QCI28565.1 efflux RND transporter permease subunit [Caminibacter pacificus]ROR40708.1 multidrug efflux pump subunit AcrB [Caminibacter pacificus]
MFEFFYKRGYLLSAIILGMFVFGVIGLIKMPKNLFPDANRPEVVIFTQVPGATASVVATTVSKPIEEEMATLSNVYQIKSTNVANFSIVHVVFDYTKTLQQASVDVSNALNRIKDKLPKNSIPAIYLVGDFTAPVDVFALSPKNNSITLPEIKKIATHFIKPKLLSNPNIGNVEVFGGYDSAVMVKIDPLKLKKYGISFDDLIKIIQTTDLNMPIGFVKTKNSFITLSFYGEKDDVKKLKNLLIKPNVRLKDIADISWSYQTNNTLYIGNNAPSIAISVQRAPSGSVLATSDAAREEMKKIEKLYPNIKVTISDTQRNLIETSNINMLEALRDAIIFTLIVLLIFLANFRALAAAALSIPMVFFGTIAYLYLTGQGLNIVIYTAIILALGMLTDDAVVVLENIERHLENKEDLQKAIYEGTKEVLKPIFAGSVSTIAIIFPLMFVGGYPEKIFKPLIETLIVALLISWFLSVTFIPKLSTLLYKKGFKKTRVEIFFEKLYQNTIAKLIKPYVGILHFSNGKFYVLRRMLLIAGAMIVLMLSVKNIMPIIGRDVMPPMDTGIMKAHIEFSSNLNAEESEKRLKPFLTWLNKQSWLEKSSIAIGTQKDVLSITGGGGGNSINMTIIAIDRFHRKKTIWQLEDEVRNELAKIPGIKKIGVYDYGATALSTINAPLDVRLLSDTYKQLPKEAQKIEKLLYNVKGLTTIMKTWDKDFNEVVIKIDTNKALSYGITPAGIAYQIALKDMPVAMLTNLSSMNVQFVRVRFNKQFENIEALKLLPIDTKKGPIPLGEIAQIKKEFTYSKIDRYNLQYAIDVEGYRKTRPVSLITDDADKLLKEHGIKNYKQAGDVSEMDDSFGRLVKAIAVGVVILILTLMVVYQSLRLALIMIVVLPLSMIGASWALLIANKPSCMPSMVGLLLLFGIIIKNAVLLIDFYKEFEHSGKSPFEAAIESVKVRFRPVMMTAFGTIAGMIPIALEWAVGLERLSPIADVAIGGLLVGTFLTLVYVPMLAYSTDPRNKKTNPLKS